MQNINQVNSKLESDKVIERESWMIQLPGELLNVLPESIWLTLSVDQKKQILRDYGIYDKYVVEPDNNKDDTNTFQENKNEITVATPQTPEVIDINSQSGIQEREVFQSQLEDIKKSEEELKNELSQDDKAMIDVETANLANTGGRGSNGVNVFGYNIPVQIINNAQSIAANSSVTDGSTWAAVLVKKILAIFD